MQSSLSRNAPAPINVAHDEQEDHSDAPGSAPTTPKKKLRPKLSSYFSHSGQTSLQPKNDALLVNINTYGARHATSYAPPTALVACQPEAEQMIDTVMQTLLCAPYKGLDAHHTSAILQVFEAYRHLRDENLLLLAKADSETNRRYAVEAETERAQRVWQTERQGFQAEVKRLEVMIATGKKGLAGVMEARQNSVINRDKERRAQERDDGKETIFEFLERSRSEERLARETQRGKPVQT